MRPLRSLVLVKVRQYQDNVVDVFHVYSPQEEATLFEMGEIVTQDPIEYLPLEVIRLVLEHMQSQHAMDMLRQVRTVPSIFTSSYVLIIFAR
jgi:hypothetical protein